MNPLINGALAGLVATAPMSLAMKVMHRALPPSEQYPLPPRLITEKITEEAGIARQLDEKDQQRLAWVAHFSYGAAVGALYAPLAKQAGLSPLTGGMFYGLTVWAGSYLGLLPALGILRPATKHPPDRTALMIAAHLVWGATMGVLVGRLQNSK